MSLKILEIVSNRLLEQKIVSELELQNILTETTMSPSEKVDAILKELDKLKDSSLKLTYWESFIEENVVLPNKEREVNN